MSRSHSYTLSSCVPENILGWDLRGGRYGKRKGKAAHPPWKVQAERIPTATVHRNEIPVWLALPRVSSHSWGKQPRPSYSQEFHTRQESPVPLAFALAERTLWVVGQRNTCPK